MREYLGGRRAALAIGIAMIVSAGGASAGVDHSELAPQFAARTHTVTAKAGDSGVELRTRYIVGLRQAPLAFAEETSGVTLPRSDANRIDVASPEARSYVASLVQRQEQFLDQVSATLGRELTPIAPEFRFQHAFNGMVVDLSADEARQVAAHPDVFLLEPEHEIPLDTDAGPTLIGANTVWNGSNVFGGLATRGEGTVVGIIDSGVNIGSPSFAAVGPVDGYVHTNPLGSGVFLGWCNLSNPNHNPARDICNNKLIGGWDFADAATAGNTAVSEARGFEDENGHGSHTASTAAGNVRQGVSFGGVLRDISGVAPHANIIIYDACHTTSTGGSCFNTATLASINQVLADGIVDVVNYSIGGGASPWNEANSLAFLALHNAGVVVSASAGNSGPGPSTLGHLEPWVMTVAASSHTRVFGFNFSLNAPGAPPANTQNITVRAGAAPIANATVTAPIIVSPNFGNGATDGCAAYPPDFFRRPATPAGTQGIAVLRLDANTSTCASGVRRAAAAAAGAVAVLFVDVTPLGLGASGLSYSMLLADWNNVATHLASDPTTAAATIAVPLAAGPGTPDVVANFSSRGPNGFALLKPDVAAPGLEILAAYDRFTSAAPLPYGGTVNAAQNDIVNAISGTSMAAPHNAGAAALLRAVNRSWTPTQIKSALVTTAKVPMTKQDGITPSDPFDRGAGRIDLTRAAKAGLVMDEAGANFSAANPATGGNPSQLNLPSFQNLSCVGTCTFPRTVRSTRVTPVTWTATVTGLPAGAASVSPSSFTLANSGAQSFTLNVDSLLLPASPAVSFGELVLTPNNAAIPTARMAIAITPAVPDIEVQPTSISETLPGGQSVSRNVTVFNRGNPTLNWSVDEVGLGQVQQLAQLGDGIRGNSTNFYNNQAPTPGGVYVAEDHTPADSGQLRRFRVEGFLTGAPANTLQVQATAFTFKIYSDAGGMPAGNPEAGAAGEVYSCVRTPTGPNSTGLSFLSADGAAFQLDASLAATAGCAAPPTLQAGTRYWFVAYPSVNSTSGQRRWVWFRSTTVNGLGGMIISPLNIATVSTTWTTVGATAGPPPSTGDFALTVSLDVQCGASWFDIAPTGASLGVGGSTAGTMTIDSTGLAVGSHRGFACFDTNGTDADEPKVVVPVTLGVLENADLELSAAAVASPIACGADAVVNYTVENNGPTVSSNVSFAATLPADVDFVSLTGPAGWTCGAPVAGVASCTKATLAAAASETLVLTTTPQAAACGGSRNFAATVAAASDGVAVNNAASAQVAIAAANLAPEFSAATYAFGVPAQPANGQFIGATPATDADAGDVLTYSITAGNTNGAFAIDPATGAISIAASAEVTAANSPFTLTVQVSDGDLVDTATVTITVLADMVFANGFEGS
jgi:subtilisin family serine protease